MNSQKRLNLFQKICLLTIFSVLILTGCGQSQVTTEEPFEFEITPTSKPTAITTSTELPTQPPPDPTPTESENISVESNLLDVVITFPSAWFSDQDMTTFDVKAYTQENKFKKTIINEDGSITVTMSKSRHKELLEDYLSTITTTVNEMIGSEDYPYIIAITPNKDFSLIYVDVNKILYNSAILDTSPFLLGMHAYFYQTLAGLPYYSEIITRDNETKEQLSSAIYPDSLTD